MQMLRRLQPEVVVVSRGYESTPHDERRPARADAQRRLNKIKRRAEGRGRGGE